MAISNSQFTSRDVHLPSVYVRRRVPTIEILGLPIAAATVAEMIEYIRLGARSTRLRLAYVNAHTLNLACGSPSLRGALTNSDVVLNDGIGVSLAARLRGRRFPANLHGSAFNTRILEMSASEGWSVFFLGGRPGIPEKAAVELRRAIPELRVAGTRHGFHHQPQHDVEAVSASCADVLFVAMGNPRQELWLERHFSDLPQVRIGVGVGAYFDFQAKAVRRAPRWMNDCGIEWVYRLAQEPRRLARRYVIGNPHFLLRVMHDRLQPRSSRPPGIHAMSSGFNGHDR